MTSICLSKTRCPECAKLGKDRSGDNLAIYSDGSCYCFGCGYYIPSSGISKLKKREPTIRHAPCLPADSNEELPTDAWKYLRNYSLTTKDIQDNTIMWSDYWKRIIFPYFNDYGLWAWQGRYLGEDKTKAKWFSQGDLHKNIHVIGNKKSSKIVLTEDVISAIRVSHNTTLCASPLFGSHISTQRFLHLKHFYDTIVVWLDKDKQKESIQFSKQARDFGINTYSVITDLDPKEYSDVEIKQLTEE